MKYLKILGLAAIAATALMAFAGSASATELTSPAGVKYSGTLSAESEGKPELSTIFGTIRCNSTVSGSITNAGGSASTVSGSISSLTWTNCEPEPCQAVTLATGTLEVHTEGATDNGNGTLTGSNQEVTTECFGLHCIWKTAASGTDLGKVTGSTTTNATFDINAAIPRVGGRSGGFCGSTGTWSGSYKVTTPSTLYVH